MIAVGTVISASRELIALQYALDYPADISRLAVLASFASLPAEMAQAVERQRADIKAKSLREIGESADTWADFLADLKDCGLPPAAGHLRCRARPKSEPQRRTEFHRPP